jgi:hypothetical protein
MHVNGSGGVASVPAANGSRLDRSISGGEQYINRL